MQKNNKIQIYKCDKYLKNSYLMVVPKDDPFSYTNPWDVCQVNHHQPNRHDFLAIHQIVFLTFKYNFLRSKIIINYQIIN